MTKEIFSKRLGLGFFISINKTEEEWLDNGKVVNFGTNFVKSEDLKSWSV